MKNSDQTALRGHKLVDFIKNVAPKERARYLLEIIEPYLYQGLSVYERPDLYNRPEEFISQSGKARVGIFKGEGYKIIVQRAAELFECSKTDIEKGYEEYKYFLPFELLDNYFYDHDLHRFIPELNQVTNRHKAERLFQDIVKGEIDRRIREQEGEGTPVCEVISDIKKDYTFWIEAPKPGHDTTQYFCWKNHIEPYLDSFEGREQPPDEFVNNFDTVPSSEVYAYFKDSLVVKGYLDEADLMPYLKAAFEFMTSPAQPFTLKKRPTKKNITKVFYTYFKDKAGHPYGKQMHYAALLGNYFSGFNTPSLASNFSKSAY